MCGKGLIQHFLRSNFISTLFNTVCITPVVYRNQICSWKRSLSTSLLYPYPKLKQWLYFTGNNYALSGTASQSNTYLTRTASNAVDGNLNTYSAATNYYNTGDYWWKVDIGERIIFTYATIYVRDGKCDPSGALFDCCK